jgi:hypothetical protein
MRRIWLTVVLLTASSVLLPAQGRRDDRDRSSFAQDDCTQNRNGRRYRHCEIRESTLSGLNPIDIDAGTNGGIRVRGWDRAEVHVRARVQAEADSQAAARSLASGVRIETAGSSVRAEGPSRTGDDESWSVSFEVDVPRTAMIALHARNGGISIADFRGTAKFETRNGGVTLGDVAGDIRGETTNGGVTVNLAGDHWDGAGLDVETHNGGVRLSVPSNYSATLEAGTVNGRLDIDFPITVQGTISQRLTTTLGSGGAKLRVVTTNGGVSIRRRE